ncbi:MAG: DNA polymerase III subunit psi [Shewanella sp.]
MNKSAYLEAMGITSWRVRDTQSGAYQVIWDEGGEQPQADPLIDTVLGLLGVSREQCEFRCEPLRGKPILWDLRRHKVRPRTAWLVSEPLGSLLDSSAAKRALWQQIWQWQAQLAHNPEQPNAV